MSMLGKWRIVETPEHDMAGPGSYILFDEDGGTFALDCLTGWTQTPTRWSNSFFDNLFKYEWERMRAPLAPPRLSELRNVEADAQAVETSSDTASQDQTDVASFEPLEPIADGFRNYHRGKQMMAPEEALIGAAIEKAAKDAGTNVKVPLREIVILSIPTWCESYNGEGTCAKSNSRASKTGGRQRAPRFEHRAISDALSSSSYRCICISLSIGIMPWFRLSMMIIDPNTTRPTTKMPNASARKLLV